MRVEANVSLRPRGTEPFGTRVEVKNMNSFRAVERAIAFEIERQAAALDAGEPLAQETRGWSEERGETYRMRVKETSDDYRYFPEPDLPPLRVDAAWLAAIRASPARAAGGAPRALPRRARAVRRTTRRSSSPTRTRRRCSRRPSRPPRRRRRRPSRTGSPGEYLRCRNDGARRVRVDAGELARHHRGRRGRVDLARQRPRGPRGARRERATAAAAIIERRGFRQISDTGALGRSSTRSSRPTRRRSPTTAPASPAVGFLVGQVMKATRGQANARCRRRGPRAPRAAGRRTPGEPVAVAS